MTTVGRELAQEAGRLLHVDDGVIRKHVCEKQARCGCSITATTPASIELARQQSLHYVLRRNSARNNATAVIAHSHAVHKLVFGINDILRFCLPLT